MKRVRRYWDIEGASTSGTTWVSARTNAIIVLGIMRRSVMGIY